MHQRRNLPGTKSDDLWQWDYNFSFKEDNT